MEKRTQVNLGLSLTQDTKEEVTINLSHNCPNTVLNFDGNIITAFKPKKYFVSNVSYGSHHINITADDLKTCTMDINVTKDKNTFDIELTPIPFDIIIHILDNYENLKLYLDNTEILVNANQKNYTVHNVISGFHYITSSAKGYHEITERVVFTSKENVYYLSLDNVHWNLGLVPVEDKLDGEVDINGKKVSVKKEDSKNEYVVPMYEFSTFRILEAFVLAEGTLILSSTSLAAQAGILMELALLPALPLVASLIMGDMIATIAPAVLVAKLFSPVNELMSEFFVPAVHDALYQLFQPGIFVDYLIVRPASYLIAYYGLGKTLWAGTAVLGTMLVEATVSLFSYYHVTIVVDPEIPHGYVVKWDDEVWDPEEGSDNLFYRVLWGPDEYIPFYKKSHVITLEATGFEKYTLKRVFKNNSVKIIIPESALVRLKGIYDCRFGMNADYQNLEGMLVGYGEEIPLVQSLEDNYIYKAAEVQPGNYYLKISADGYHEEYTRIAIGEGYDFFPITLIGDPFTLTVTMDKEYSNIQVMVDNYKLYSNGLVYKKPFTNYSDEGYLIKISADGYYSLTQREYLEPAKPNVNIHLIGLPQTVVIIPAQEYENLKIYWDEEEVPLGELGRYVVAGVDYGNHNISATADGYESVYNETVSVSYNQTQFPINLNAKPFDVTFVVNECGKDTIFLLNGVELLVEKGAKVMFKAKGVREKEYHVQIYSTGCKNVDQYITLSTKQKRVTFTLKPVVFDVDINLPKDCVDPQVWFDGNLIKLDEETGKYIAYDKPYGTYSLEVITKGYAKFTENILCTEFDHSIYPTLIPGYDVTVEFARDYPINKEVYFGDIPVQLDNGKYCKEGVTEGDYELKVLCEPNSSLTTAKQYDDWYGTIHVDEFHHKFIITLTKKFILEGQIYDNTGYIEGAVVKFNSNITSVTDKNGIYSLIFDQDPTDLQGIDLTVSKEGYIDNCEHIDYVPQLYEYRSYIYMTVDCIETKGTFIHGYVRTTEKSESGELLPAKNCSLRFTHTDEPLSVQVTTNEAGYYEFPNPFTGTYDVTIFGSYVSKYYEPNSCFFRPGAEYLTVDYKVEPRIDTITGYVMDPNGALEGVHVTVKAGDRVIESSTDDIGGYDIEFIHTENIHNIEVTLEKDGYESVTEIIELSDDEREYSFNCTDFTTGIDKYTCIRLTGRIVGNVYGEERKKIPIGKAKIKLENVLDPIEYVWEGTTASKTGKYQLLNFPAGWTNVSVDPIGDFSGYTGQYFIRPESDAVIPDIVLPLESRSFTVTVIDRTSWKMVNEQVTVKNRVTQEIVGIGLTNEEGVAEIGIDPYIYDELEIIVRDEVRHCPYYTTNYCIQVEDCFHVAAYGTIIDHSTGKPIYDVKVSNVTEGYDVSTFTDTDGRFTIIWQESFSTLPSEYIMECFVPQYHPEFIRLSTERLWHTNSYTYSISFSLQPYIDGTI